MDIFAFPLIAWLLEVAYSALMGLSDLLSPIAGTASAALAVVIVTLIVRTALVPVGISQAKAEQTRARLAPKLRAIQERHRKNPERLQRETMQLYKDEQASPFAGCLPMLVQMPVVGLIYALFLHHSIAGHANALLTHELFGVPLGTSLVGAIGAGALTWQIAAVTGGIMLLIALVGELTRRLFRPQQMPEGSPLGSPTAMRMLGALQFATAVIAAFVPVAAGVYLAVTVSWTLVQRLVLRRRYPAPVA